MKSRKYKQREEVRSILHAMRLELAAERLAQDKLGHQSMLRIDQLLTRARQVSS
ncbi:MAG: hypothetical protein M3Q79_02070 [bacterium]|nr:hypothetical protein [bacterium]